jgi:hypothetical protein
MEKQRNPVEITPDDSAENIIKIVFLKLVSSSDDGWQLLLKGMGQYR